MHIHPSSPNSSQSEESAATKIQAGFRGYRVRKQLRSIRHHHNHHHHHHHRRHMMMDRKNSFEPRSIGRNSESEDSSVEEKCATKIQAGVRGYLVRKKQKIATEAATKIQAGFRGFKARKEVEKLKQK